MPVAMFSLCVCALKFLFPLLRRVQLRNLPAHFMRILVIGSGGREHALVWKLAQSPHVTQLWCATGNAGIAQERTEKTERQVECVNIAAEELLKLLAFAQEKKIELTVVGPDNPLALGI